MTRLGDFIDEILLSNSELKLEFDRISLSSEVRSKLIAYRKVYKITQKEFGKRIGVSQNAISRFELGKHDPQISFVEKILVEILDTHINKKITVNMSTHNPEVLNYQSKLLSEIINLISVSPFGKPYVYHQYKKITKLDDAFSVNNMKNIVGRVIDIKSYKNHIEFSIEIFKNNKGLLFDKMIPKRTNEISIKPNIIMKDGKMKLLSLVLDMEKLC